MFAALYITYQTTGGLLGFLLGPNDLSIVVKGSVLGHSIKGERRDLLQTHQRDICDTSFFSFRQELVVDLAGTEHQRLLGSNAYGVRKRPVAKITQYNHMPMIRTLTLSALLTMFSSVSSMARLNLVPGPISSRGDTQRL